jgi:hypothetical protein
MAITKIQYQNKVAIEDDPSVAEINKVTDTNMNEIKSVVNNNADILTAVETEVGDIGEALDIINGEEI